MKIAGLLLSAGLSSRMASFKPLMKFEDATFISTIIKKMIVVCEKVFVVMGYNSDKIKEELQFIFKDEIDKIIFIFNKNYELGMFSSLQAGLNEAENYDWILYHFVDQPTLPFEFYNELIEQIDNSFDWIQPVYNEQKGHPILFNKKISKLILSENINSSLKKISRIESIKKKFYNCFYNQILNDIDTISDYDKFSSFNT